MTMWSSPTLTRVYVVMGMYSFEKPKIYKSFSSANEKQLSPRDKIHEGFAIVADDEIHLLRIASTVKKFADADDLQPRSS